MGVSGLESDLKHLVGDILDEARRQGATAAEVSVGDDEGLTIVVRQRDIETIEFSQDRGFGITVYAGARKGTATTSDSRPEAVRATVGAALGIARHTEDDECNGLADPERMARDLPDLDLHHPWTMDAYALRDLALETEATALDYDGRIVNSEGAEVATQRSCRVYGNSHGFVGAVTGTRHSVHCAVVAGDDAGMERDQFYSIARDPENLDSHVSIGEEAARRALARLGTKPIRTGNWPVLFSPRMAAGLIGHLVGAISGGALYRRASYLTDSLGKPVAAKGITLAEYPHLPKGLGSAGFDGDGVATASKAFVHAGRLDHYVLGSYSARRLGMQTTGNAGGVFNLRLETDTVCPKALMREMGTGLVVTELMGQGIDLVSGHYSRAAAGFWIENGEPAFPVEKVTIASTLNEMYHGIVAAGDDIDRRSNVHTGSILVRSMTVAN
ncbi:MAG: metalloprotease PmbA [Gammaproteobacteria bacterium]|nr:metalloprotease PmbA [Gammaproteobacteria bacterium]